MGVLTRDTLQLWEISMPMPKLISRVDLLPCIKKYITKELLSGDLEDEVQIRAFDMSAYKARQLVMVVSYYIPSMGEYCQFAVLVFQIHEVFTQQDHSVIEHEYIIQDAISLPYSAIMQCMKRTPTISVSGDSDIAFVTFEDTVVSVGLSRRSTFEVSIHLKPTTGNVFLAALAQPTTSIQGNDLSSTEALVFTTQSGILSLQINSPAALSASESLMNGSSTKDRSTALLEDRLKQAVFFEDQKQSPLYFPLAIECGRGDLQAAALSLARTLLHGSSSLMTPETDTHPYPLSRYKYIVNIAKILNKYNLIDEVQLNFLKKKRNKKKQKDTGHRNLILCFLLASCGG
ncbi:hypothetical protein BDF14DRAFT_519916 [Spinellus fusiger]|nr:hypothetical protein BDF14DRAFT_519916 [Spinellus fusiger]